MVLSLAVISIPGDFMSTMKHEMPPCDPLAGSATAIT